MSPRIAFFTNVYAKAGIGGSTFTTYLRDATLAGEIDVTFFSTALTAPQHSFEKPITLPSYARFPISQFVRSRQYHQAFLRTHQENPFDIIWHNNAITGIHSLSQTRPVPIVGMINDSISALSVTPLALQSQLGSRQAISRWIWRGLEKSAAQKCDLVVTNSDYLSSILIDQYNLAREKVERLYKAVSLSQFPHALRASTSQPLRFLFVKQNFVVGGLQELLIALSGIEQPIELTVIGPRPSAFDTIREWVQKSGFHHKLNLVGVVERSEIADYFAQHDFLCVPSRTEALGVVFLEAIASGLTAIGTSVGGIPEALADGKAGWLAPTADPAGLRQTILEAITNPKERAKRREYGRQHVETFSAQTMIKNFKAINETLLGTRAIV